MNAPAYINNAHKALSRNPGGLTLEELSGKLRAKALKVSQQIRELHDAGLIETTEDAGQPVYRLIAAPAAESAESGRDDSSLPTKTYSPAVLQSMIADLSSDSEGGETDAPAVDADKWIPFEATADSVCPVPAGTRVRYWLEDGDSGVCLAERLSWRDSGDGMFYPIVAYKISQPAAADFATSPELQYLAPEDYEMPPADPVLLASANKMLCERMEAIAEQLRAGTIPELENVTGAEDLAPHVKTLCDALGAAESVVTARGHTINGYRLEVADLRERLDAQIKQWQADTGRLAADLRAATEARSQAINEADRLRAELAAERRAREALQEKGSATDVTAAAVGYLVRVPKRPPMIRRKPEAARLAALGAVRAGAARADVLAIVPVGAARRGAEWGDA